MDGLQLNDIVLIGRTFDEYRRIFDLASIPREAKFLDAGAGVSSFCAEANALGWNVTASDRIYGLAPDVIETKCAADLVEVMRQMPALAGGYRWSYYPDLAALEEHRCRAYTLFVEDYRKFGTKRYVPAEYPSTGFRDGQFDVALVSHFLLLYDDKLDYDFHVRTLRELLRVAANEVRIFPVLNMKGERSRWLDRLMRDPQFRNVRFELRPVDFEFLKDANEVLVVSRER